MIRIIFGLLVLCSSFAYAGQNFWLSIEPDHFNYLYNAGEHANFLLRQNNVPTSPGFRIKIIAEIVGSVAPQEVSFENMTTVWSTPALTAGSFIAHIETHLIGPASDQIVQNNSLVLEVQP
jgi:hypothetical protein